MAGNWNVELTKALPDERLSRRNPYEDPRAERLGVQALEKASERRRGR